MRNGHLLIAAGVVGGFLALVTAALVLNGIGQVRGTFTYVPPGEFWTLCKIVFGASVTILTLGGIAEWRRSRSEKEKDK